MAPWQTDRNLEPARAKVNTSRVEPCSSEAGAKCTTCLGVIAVFALIVVTACGGGGSSSGSSGDNPTYGGTLSVDNLFGDHQHTFFVPASIVTAPPSTGFVGNTSNNFPPEQRGDPHNHSIFLTQGELSDLEAGVPVTGDSLRRFFHSHSFVFGSSGSAGPIDAPASLSGRTIDARITSGSGLLASQGTFRASFAASTFLILGDGADTVNSSGSYTYSAIGSVGTVNFNDTQSGSGVFAFTYTSATGGTYSVNIAAGGSQAGTFVEP